MLTIISISFAQEADSIKTSSDIKTAKEWSLSGLRIGTDISYPIGMIFDLDKKRAEVSTEFYLKNKFFFGIDLGYSQMRSVKSYGNTFEYINTGSYFRVGMDYNLLHKHLKKESVFMGLHYGMASYKHKLSYFNYGNYWTDFFNKIEEKDMKASWVEWTGGVKAYLFKNIFVGYTLRMQVLLNKEDGAQLRATDIPGYGKVAKHVNPGMNYHIYYRLPLFK